MELDELRRIAAKEELSLNFVAKDEMISKALFELQGFDNIILKGGTAINRVYLNNKRFSEDIDFDIVFSGNIKECVAVTKKLVEKLKGFEVPKPRIMNHSIRYDLFYINPLNHKDRIMVEFKPIKKALNYGKKIINFGFVPCNSALLNVYDVEELIKHKIDCIMNRLEGKDFFDLYYLLDITHKKIAELKKDKGLMIKRITLEEKQIKAVANVINHYVPRNQRPEWDIFLEELKKKIERY